MKNSFYKFLFAVLPVMLIFSCVKESDTLTPNTTNPPPVENTDVYTVTGLVKDTLNQPIGGASLKAYFDDLEIETMSDMDGNYEFKIPKSKTEGYIVGSKEKYNKAIKSIEQTANSIQKSIYLFGNKEVDSEDLALPLENLLVIRGRVVDESGQPLNGASAFFLGLTNINMTLGVTGGYDETDTQGNFEIIVENQDYWSKSVRGNFSGTCWTGFYKSWSDDEPVKELGEIILTQETLISFSTNVSISNCASPNAVSNFYFLDDLITNIVDEPVGELKKEFCNDPNRSDLVYIGAESEDQTEFNGSFQNFDQLQPNNDFELCTPGDHFLEIVIDGDTTIVDSNLKYDRQTETIGNEFFADINYFFFFGSSGSLSSGGEIIIQFGLAGGVCLDENGTAIYTLDSETPFHVNYVEDNDQIISGIAVGKVKIEADGSTKDAKIRFRIIK